MPEKKKKEIKDQIKSPGTHSVQQMNCGGFRGKVLVCVSIHPLLLFFASSSFSTLESTSPSEINTLLQQMPNDPTLTCSPHGCSREDPTNSKALEHPSFVFFFLNRKDPAKKKKV